MCAGNGGGAGYTPMGRPPGSDDRTGFGRPQQPPTLAPSGPETAVMSKPFVVNEAQPPTMAPPTMEQPRAVADPYRDYGPKLAPQVTGGNDYFGAPGVNQGFQGQYRPPNRYTQASQFQPQFQGRPMGYPQGMIPGDPNRGGAMRFNPTPFVPGMGLYGEYGNPGPGGFTGSVQNGMNFINNGSRDVLYQPQGLNQNNGAMDPNMQTFINYLNSYGRR